MPCGCTQNGVKQTFIYTDPNGVQKSYRTEIEAKAAQVRTGGGGSIRAEAVK